MPIVGATIPTVIKRRVILLLIFPNKNFLSSNGSLPTQRTFFKVLIYFEVKYVIMFFPAAHDAAESYEDLHLFLQFVKDNSFLKSF